MCPFHGWLYDGETGKCVGTFFLIKITTEKLFEASMLNIMMTFARKEKN